VQIKAERPEPRMHPTMVLTLDQDALVVFGGQDEKKAALNDVWIFHFGTHGEEYNPSYHLKFINCIMLYIASN
jgi:hypothetical protein